MEVDLGSLTSTWVAAIKAAEESKANFNRTAEICQTFFTGSMDAMWNDTYRTKFLGGMPAPQFRLTLNKTFELTSIVGPSLMWADAGRIASMYSALEIDPSVMPAIRGLDLRSPEAAQMAEQYMSEMATERAINDATCKIMERYLNYSQREQPGGGLKNQSRLAILDALIKGRGVIKVDTYKPHGVDYELTGGFRIDVDDLFIDPNCKQGDLSGCKWIAIRHCDPHWEVERRFGWNRNSLKGKGTSVASKMGAEIQKMNKAPRSVNDLTIWYEIFSLCGVGTRFNGAGSQDLHQAFEDEVGDEAYLCVCPGVREFLNFRNAEASTIEMPRLKARLDWPVPYYRDGRWPIALLDFWDNPKSCWPIATVSAGIGQLTVMNLILCSIAEKAFRDSLDKVAISNILDNDTVAKILSLRHEVISLNPSSGETIDQFISTVKRSPLNLDVWRMVEIMSASFDKAVGLTDMMYGLNPGGKVTRTAADANIKGEAVAVRPEFMASRVEEWHTDIANIERIAAGYSVDGAVTRPLLGALGSELWTELITKADPDLYMREMTIMIEAGSTRRPNKAKEAQNMQQMSAFLLPVAQWYAGSTGNTEPLNNIVKSIGKSIDQDTAAWAFPQIQPQQQGPSEEEVAAMQEDREMSKAKQMAAINKLNLTNAEKAHKMMELGIGVPPDDVDGFVPAPDESEEEPLDFYGA
jgi:hypothetical protein